MSKKIFVCTLLLTIMCFSMSFLYNKGSDHQSGLPFTEGYVIDGKFTPTGSGTIGGNSEKSKELSDGADIFNNLGYFCGTICIASFIHICVSKRKNEISKGGNN